MEGRVALPAADSGYQGPTGAGAGGPGGGRRRPDTPVLKYDHVWLDYGDGPVVEDITFALEAGDFAAVLGPNGSGKTTLLKLALGLLSPTRGKVSILGETSDRFRHWDLVGYVPQVVEGMHQRFPATVEEVVGYGLYRGFDPLAAFRGAGHSKIAAALETAGISHLGKRRVSDLSVGQEQRVLIARAVVREPHILLLDEPVASVDAAGQEQFYSLLRRLNQEMGVTIVIVTHDIGAVIHEATTCACINRTMVFHGPTHEFSSDDIAHLYGVPMDVLLHDALHTHR